MLDDGFAARGKAVAGQYLFLSLKKKIYYYLMQALLCIQARRCVINPVLGQVLC